MSSEKLDSLLREAATEFHTVAGDTLDSAAKEQAIIEALLAFQGAQASEARVERPTFGLGWARLATACCLVLVCGLSALLLKSRTANSPSTFTYQDPLSRELSDFAAWGEFDEASSAVFAQVAAETADWEEISGWDFVGLNEEFIGDTSSLGDVYDNIYELDFSTIYEFTTYEMEEMYHETT